MKGLLIKDFYVITKQLNIFLLVMIILAMTSDINMIMIFTIVFTVSLPITSIAYDEHSKWDELASMMPYSKEEIVISKYLIGYFSMLVFIVLILFGKALGDNILPNNNDEISIIILLITSLIFIAINIPIIFKFGTEKGRFITIFLIIFGSNFVIMSDISKTITQIPQAILLVVAIVLNVLSIGISLKIKSSNK